MKLYLINLTMNVRPACEILNYVYAKNEEEVIDLFENNFLSVDWELVDIIELKDAQILRDLCQVVPNPT